MVLYDPGACGCTACGDCLYVHIMLVRAHVLVRVSLRLLSILIILGNALLRDELQ